MTSTSTKLKAEIAELTARRQDIQGQHVTATDELRKVQKAFAKGRAAVEEVTTAQAKFSGIGGALEMLEQEVSALQIEYSIAVRDENRAAQLAQLETHCEAANQSWREYSDAYANAVRAVEHAAKSLFAADQNHRDQIQAVARFCSGSGLSLSDAKDKGVDTTGASEIIHYFAFNPSGQMSDSETARYEVHLNELMVFVEGCAKSLRPCPTPPADKKYSKAR